MTTRTYLDADGGAPLHPAAVQALTAATAEGWADPRRLHSEGRQARLLLEGARVSLAADLGCRTEEVHLAPNHTVALHNAVLGVAHGRRRTGRGVVLSAVERTAVHTAAGQVVGDDGAPTVVAVDRQGRVELPVWQEAVARTGVAVAALQHANGEVGTRQPLPEAYAAAQAAGVPLLVDAGSSLGQDTVPQTWDLLAADPRSWGAPAGVAVLAVRSRVRAAASWPHDEDTWFPGGISVPAAFAAAVSLQAVQDDRAVADAERRALVARAREAILRDVPDVEVVGDPDDRLPHVLTFSCLFVDGEALLTELDREGYAVGSGSACTASTLLPSHVLAAMGVLTHGNVRVSLLPETPDAAVDGLLEVLPRTVAALRARSGADAL